MTNARIAGDDVPQDRSMSSDANIAPELNRSALLIIDMQADFLDTGSSPVAGTVAVLPAIRRVLDAYRTAARPILHVVRLYQADDVDLPRRSLVTAGAQIVRPGSPGSQIEPSLLPSGAHQLDPAALLDGRLQPLGEREWAMWKPRWSAFYRTPLHEHLQALHLSTVVLAGCNYPNCPRATIYGASERDYRIVLIDDAISRLLPNHLAEAAEIGVLHATSDQAADRLARTAEAAPATARRTVRTPPERSTSSATGIACPRSHSTIRSSGSSLDVAQDPA